MSMMQSALDVLMNQAGSLSVRCKVGLMNQTGNLQFKLKVFSTDDSEGSIFDIFGRELGAARHNWNNWSTCRNN